MKFWKILPLLLAMLFTGCGTQGNAEKKTGMPMSVYPTEFSSETKKVLDILDDEVMFFTYHTDETVRSVDLQIWFCEDGVWTSAGNVKGNKDATERDIVLRVKETEVDLIQISDTGQSKYTFPVLTEFEASLMMLEWRLQNTEPIVLEEEIVLYYKIATEENAIRSEGDFRDLPCREGMALTITFSAEDVD